MNYSYWNRYLLLSGVLGALGFVLGIGQAQTVYTPLRVTGVEPNLSDGTLIISGRNLGTEFRGKASLYTPHLGEVELLLEAFDPERQELKAHLPDSIDSFPGSYQLTVSTGNALFESDEFTVAIHPPLQVSNGVLSLDSASGRNATLVDPSVNRIVGVRASVGGGEANVAEGDKATIGGGEGNAASTWFSTIAGGRKNLARGVGATVGGGTGNQADGWNSIVAGGDNNLATGVYATIGGGQRNKAFGFGAVVPGGSDNRADGQHSVAMGTGAFARHDGAFVWADKIGRNHEVPEKDQVFTSLAANEFSVRATGGVRFLSNSAAKSGVTLSPGATAWSQVLDRDLKRDLAPANPRTILESLARVPMSTWRYVWEGEGETPHIGPSAQDFKETFFPGRDSTVITTLEAEGVALTAIQGLNTKLEQQLKLSEVRIQDLEAELEALTRSVTELSERLLR